MKTPYGTIRNDDLILLGVGGVLLFLMLPKIAQAGAKAIVGTAADTAAGVVIGAGQGIGIPETSMTKCQADIAAGRTWDASFDCPAGDFIKYLFGGGMPTAEGS